MLVGVLAPVVAIAYARSPDRNSDLVLAWNVFGVMDFAVAVGAELRVLPGHISSLRSISPATSSPSFPSS